MTATGTNYTFDNNGNQISAYQVSAGTSRSFVYDLENRLTQVADWPDPADQPLRPGDPCADFDNNGTVGFGDLLVLARAYNSVGGTDAAYSPDVDLHRDGQIGFDDLLTFARDYNKSCTVNDVAAYNGDGLRVYRNEGGVKTKYTWDVAASLPVILQESPGNTYEYGVGLVLQDSGGTPAWYLQDGLESTVGLASNAGALTATYRYDAYGAVRGTTGSPAAAFTFDGEQTDASGLVYVRARYYDPGTGRFLTQDTAPVRASYPPSLNAYSFVGDDPITRVDPSGMWCPRDPGDCVPKPVKKIARAFETGYVDVSVTGCYWICITGGVQFGRHQGLHLFVGPGVGTPGGGIGVYLFPDQSIAQGLNCEGAGGVAAWPVPGVFGVGGGGAVSTHINTKESWPFSHPFGGFGPYGGFSGGGFACYWVFSSLF